MVHIAMQKLNSRYTEANFCLSISYLANAMNCRSCNKSFNVCLNTSPGMFFIVACIFAAAFVVLLGIAFVWNQIAAIAATAITGLGAVWFFFESDSKMRWAAGFNDNSTCPNCGQPYVVWWWTRNESDYW